jgi:hypothetical protein
VFGLDEVEVRLAGQVKGTTACCAGAAEQAPGMRFEATLFFGEDASPPPDRKRATANLNRLPNGDSRHQARNPFARGLS